jgi:transcriptional regulator with XRE-family HTH domain
MTITVESAFSNELRRWRTARRVSQLELAVRAGTTQRHLSFIERGRSRPGRSMVIRLGESLGLSLRERNSLLHAAGFAPVFTESRLDDPLLRPVRDALQGVLDGHLPYPAVVLHPYGELLAANSAIDLLLEGVSPSLLEEPLNLLRVMLHPDGMARRVQNLSDWGRHILDNLRAKAVSHPDHRLDELIVELSGYVPGIPPSPDYIGFALPLRLQTEDGELHLLTTLTSFATATDVTLAELRLEAFLPADESSAAILRARAAKTSAHPGTVSG